MSKMDQQRWHTRKVAWFLLPDREPADVLAIPDSANNVASPGNGVLDELLGQLADLVAGKVAARLAAPRSDAADEWLDTRRAAEYLGIHRDSLRRLAAQGVIAAEQAGAGCKALLPQVGSGCVAPSGIVVGGWHPESAPWLILISSTARPRRARDLPPPDRRARGLLQGRERPPALAHFRRRAPGRSEAS